MSIEKTKKRRRVLIVDDQPVNVQVMGQALKQEYDVLFATSGKKALEIVSAGEVDLILLDVVMPEMDGFETCRRIKADEATAEIPIIFVTAKEEVEDEEEGFNVGGVDYIAKPVRPPIVRARVRTHLELKDARDQLRRLALVDQLTGIPNRRRLDMFLEREWMRAVRRAGCFSVGLLDVDYFKKYNDRYGHGAGDECLIAVASSLEKAVQRSGDMVARYGGEEFAFVLPETDAVGTRSVMLEVLQNVADLQIPHEGSDCDSFVSVSIGAVTVRPDTSMLQDELFQKADELLYIAKETGRRHCLLLDDTRGVRERLEVPERIST